MLDGLHEDLNRISYSEGRLACQPMTKAEEDRIEQASDDLQAHRPRRSENVFTENTLDLPEMPGASPITDRAPPTALETVSTI